MKILFFGDSITDAGRWRDVDSIYSYGVGFVRMIADRLVSEEPEKYKIVTRGISGERIVDLYARIKKDVWNENPDVISILVGINDIWHEINYNNGVDVERYEKVYRMMIEDTKKALPNTRLILCEPFVLEGSATSNTEEKPDRYERFCQVYEYAKVVKNLAEEYGLTFVPLQETFTHVAEKSKAEYYLSDGVHPDVAGANLIAKEWIKHF